MIKVSTIYVKKLGIKFLIVPPNCPTAKCTLRKHVSLFHVLPCNAFCVAGPTASNCLKYHRNRTLPLTCNKIQRNCKKITGNCRRRLHSADSKFITEQNMELRTRNEFIFYCSYSHKCNKPATSNFMVLYSTVKRQTLCHFTALV